ncbi:MAG TPA: T9SS type A sorting domain-containing protein [Bacteroidia bacterium]|nr:T9SS type A sorting domain-containing protein [Bacteroidia bacterium]
MKKTVLLLIAGLAATLAFGQKWSLSHSLPTGVRFVDAVPVENQVIAASTRGIYRTADSGKTWDSVHYFNALSVSCFDKNNCYACGENGTVFKTTDGGQTWAQTNNVQTNKNLFYVKALSATKVVVVAQGGAPYFKTDSMFVSLDNGNSWSAAPVSPSLSNHPIVYVFDDNLIFSERTADPFFSDIRFTRDYGQNYTDPSIPSNTGTFSYPLQIDMIDGKTGFMLFYEPTGVDHPFITIIKTTDSAKTFTTVTQSDGILDPASEGVEMGSFDFINDTTGWVAGKFGLTSPFRGIYKTNNGGNNWVMDTLGFINTGLSGHRIKLRMVSHTYGFAFDANNTGRIIKYQDTTSSSGPTTSINELNAAGIVVYPNPSADGIFHISNMNDIKSIRVIDITGREAGVLSANTISLSGQAPGVYFVIATTASGNTFYKKLIKE